MMWVCDFKKPRSAPIGGQATVRDLRDEGYQCN